MITCNSCGQHNEDYARVCKKCGTSLWLSGRPSSADLPRNPPGVRSQPARPPYTPPAFGAYHPPAPQPQPFAQPAPFAPPAHVAGTGFTCPYCKSKQLPINVEKISQGGWIVFVLMLLFCFPFFWVGLLMKENERYCVSCRMRLG
jgi:hypothetical protein